MNNKNTWKAPSCFEMHSDIPVDIALRSLNGEKNILVEHYLSKYQQGGVNGTLLIVGGDEGSGNEALVEIALSNTLSTLDIVLSELEKTEQFSLITSAKDLRQMRDSSSISVVLGLEGARPVGKSLAMLRHLYRLGVRLIGLTWNDRNEVASGVGEGRRAGGLSKFGEKMIAEMNELGMIIDVSHLSPQGLTDVLALSAAPIFASHSNSRTMCDHPRNIEDKHIKRIAEQGGLIGAVFFPAFVGPNPTLDTVVEHIAHLLNIAGEDGVGLGMDFIDYAEESYSKTLAASSVDYGQSLRYPQGIENITKVKDLLYCLHRKGYSDDLIDKIAWTNFARFFADVCK